MNPFSLGIVAFFQFWWGVRDACYATDGFLAELEARGDARASHDYQHRPPIG